MPNLPFLRQQELVFCPRGELVDSQALRDALLTDQIAGAGLDTL